MPPTYEFEHNMNLLRSNAATLEKELAWLQRVIDNRIKMHFDKKKQQQRLNNDSQGQIDTEKGYDISAPDLSIEGSLYAHFVRHHKLDPIDRILILLALVPHLKPELLDCLYIKNSLYDRNFTEFGGVLHGQHSGFLPTGETAVFILAGNSLRDRLYCLQRFEPDYLLMSHHIIELNVDIKTPLLNGRLNIGAEYLQLFTTGEDYTPRFSSSFPAKRIATKLDWEDLVLEEHLLFEVKEIEAWLRHQETIMEDWELNRKIKPGYRALFYGPPGTGKTLTASLLGKSTGLAVYRIDLSQVVSKWIGETEKNMANIFDQAENKNWILFFDEADALFGKRTGVSDAKDMHANQQVAYLLQRVEDFPGVVILATNLRSNIDEAFARRFQNMIYFPVPTAQLRLRLWEKAFGNKMTLHEGVDLPMIAEKYSITGGAIINVLRYCALMALRNNSNVVMQDYIIQGIRKEFAKEGKTV